MLHPLVLYALALTPAMAAALCPAQPPSVLVHPINNNVSPTPQVFYYELMEVNDFRNDVILAEACRNDVEKYCKDVQPGGRGAS